MATCILALLLVLGSKIQKISTSKATDKMIPDGSSHDCKIVSIYGFLKRFCGHLYRNGETLDDIPDRMTSAKQLDLYRDAHPELVLQCATSSQYYIWKDTFYSTEGGFLEEIRISAMCPDDPGAYQACGLALEYGKDMVVDNSLALCGAQLCVDRPNDKFAFGLCEVDKTVTGSAYCDGKCADFGCEDEEWCNGVQYGIYCYSTIRGDDVVYINPYEVSVYTIVRDTYYKNEIVGFDSSG